LLIGLLCGAINQPAAIAAGRCLSWNCYCESKSYPSIEQFANRFGIQTIYDDMGTPQEHNCGVSFRWKNPKSVGQAGCQQKAQEFFTAWEKNEKSLVPIQLIGFVNLSWLYNCDE
jgi:hypothetical protein